MKNTAQTSSMNDSRRMDRREAIKWMLTASAAISVLELVTFGAVGRLWLGGAEEDIQQAAQAVDAVLAGLPGRPNGDSR